MLLTEIRINLCDELAAGRLKAFCSLTFDNTFVIRDVKLIDGNDGIFLAMPSRKLCDRCRKCGEKNHLRARFCNNCGGRLDDTRHLRLPHPGSARPKLHADIAHPITVSCRQGIQQQVLSAYGKELELSKLPGYVPQKLDPDDVDLYDDHPSSGASPSKGALPKTPGPALRAG